MKPFRLLLYGFVLFPIGGCKLQEIVSKTKIGPEFRHDGGSQANNMRWTTQQGFQFKFEKGVSTAVTYRRRDVSNDDGDWDDGVWVDFDFPIWRAPKKPDPIKQQVEILEQRLADLEAQQNLGVQP